MDIFVANSERNTQNTTPWPKLILRTVPLGLELGLAPQNPNTAVAKPKALHTSTRRRRWTQQTRKIQTMPSTWTQWYEIATLFETWPNSLASISETIPRL